MPDRTQDLKNHRQVTVACKNYTDTEIKKSEERILSIVARNNVRYIDHTNEPTYRFTAPLNSKLLMLQSIAGNSNKIAPSTPSDDSVARLKAIPNNTYKSQIDYIGGKSVKYNQLFETTDYTLTRNNVTITRVASTKTITVTTNGTASANGDLPLGRTTYTPNHKYLFHYVGTKTSLNIVIQQTNGSTWVRNKNTSAGNDIILDYTETDATNLNFVASFTSGSVPSAEMKIEIIDLTDKFGAGNEPSDVSTAIQLLKANGYKLDGTDEYSTGSLKHAITTSAVYSGNYVKYNNSITNNGITFTPQDDGTIATSGTSTGRAQAFITDISLGKGTYTLSLAERIGTTARTGTACFIRYNNNGSMVYIDLGDVYTSLQFTLNENKTIDFCIEFRNSGMSANGYVFKPMLTKGSTAPSTFIPYTQPITKAIPSEVLADVRYGLGFDNTNYNHLDSDGHLRGSWGIVDLGTLNYAKHNEYKCFYAQITDKKIGIANILCKYDSINLSMGVNTIINYPNIIGQNASNNYIYFYNDTTAEMTVEQFKTYISGVYLVYELANAFDQDYSQYFTPNWNKVDLNKQYTTCEMVCAEPIDMPNKVEYYGTIIHSLATAVKQEGFNVFNAVGRTAGTYDSSNPSFSDEKYYGSFSLNGNYYSTQGVATLTSTSEGNVVVNVVNAGYGIAFPIKVIVGETYHIDFTASSNNTNVGYFFVDYNGNKTNGSYSNTSYNVNIPNNCEYLVLVFGGNSTGAHTFSNICINISSQDLNGTYKPYKAPITRLLPNSEAKYSWGITDGVRNTRVFCDDECNPVNKGQVDVGNQDLDSLEYRYNSSAGFMYATISDIKSITSGMPNALISNNYTLVDASALSVASDKSYTTYTAGVYFKDSAYTDTTLFKNHFFDDKLLYQKNATTPETLDDFDFSFDCEEGDTFTIIGCELLQCYATYSFLIKEAKSNE